MQIEMGEGDAEPKAKPKDKTKGRKRPMFSFQIAEETILWKTIVTSTIKTILEQTKTNLVCMFGSAS